MEIMVRFRGKEFSEKKSFKDSSIAVGWVERNLDKIAEINYHPTETYGLNVDGVGLRKLNKLEIYRAVCDCSWCG